MFCRWLSMTGVRESRRCLPRSCTRRRVGSVGDLVHARVSCGRGAIGARLSAHPRARMPPAKGPRNLRMSESKLDKLERCRSINPAPTCPWSANCVQDLSSCGSRTWPPTSPKRMAGLMVSVMGVLPLSERASRFQTTNAARCCSCWM